MTISPNKTRVLRAKFVASALDFKSSILFHYLATLISFTDFTTRMSMKTFRPGQFGIFTVVESGSDINRIITDALSDVVCLRLKNVEWIDLGSQIMAILFSSFRSQIYLSEWQVIFRHMFVNTVSAEQLRENSKRVVRIVSEARQLNALCVNHFEVIYILYQSKHYTY